MTILVDANVILDVLQERQPHYPDSEFVLRLCASRKVKGVIAAHSLPTMFYVLKKYYDSHEIRQALIDVCNIFSISPINEQKIMTALYNESFTDFEDNLQEECAVENEADYIITRDQRDYKMSRIPALHPAEFKILYEQC